MNCDLIDVGWVKQAVDIGKYEIGYGTESRRWVCDGLVGAWPDATNTLSYTELGWAMLIGACAGILALTFRDKIKKVFVD